MTSTKGTKKETATVPADQAKVMAGVLAILVAEREERLNGTDHKNKPAKTEVLLSNAGLSATEIAQVMGKNLAAVQKTIQRGRK
jgi:DNA-directed RNA polymerase specialized sigma24 family protein